MRVHSGWAKISTRVTSSGSIQRMKPVSWHPLLWIMIGAAALRLLLFFSYPAHLTADSWDYLLAAQDLSKSFNFASQGLRDWRMPGYSLLLAAAQPWTAAQSDRIVLLQAASSLLTVLLAYAAGVMVQSQVTAVGWALFVAFNPVYLLFDHTIMNESLTILTLVFFLAAVTWAGRWQRAPWAAGAVVAGACALCVLTRANLLVICVAGMLAPPICWFVGRGVRNAALRGQVVRYATAAAMVLVLLVGPWLLRNYVLYGRASLLVSLTRNLLVYKAMYSQVDTTLPKLASASRELGSESVDYDWLWRLAAVYPAPQAEAIAGSLWWEQVAAHPVQYVGDIAKAAAGLAGFYYWGAGDLPSVQVWLDRYMTDPHLLDENNRRVEGHGGFHYAAAARSGGVLDMAVQVWAKAGLLYLYWGRALLTLALLAVYGRYVWGLRRRRWRGWDSRDVILVTFFAAFVANAVLHAMTLAVNDRFVCTFDVLAVFLLLLAADTSVRAKTPYEVRSEAVASEDTLSGGCVTLAVGLWKGQPFSYEGASSAGLWER